MPLSIIRNDITKMQVDAVVNAANTSLLGGGGVDGSIHKAAGPKLLAACKKLGGCETGSAKLTKGYNLPARYIIHAVGPIYQDGKHGERELLISCYQTSLKLAVASNCKTVAFPLISAGIYGYPKEEALQIAIDTIGGFLEHTELTVYLVIFDKTAYKLSASLYTDIQSYIDDHYVDAHTDSPARRMQRQASLWDVVPDHPILPQASNKQPEHKKQDTDASETDHILKIFSAPEKTTAASSSRKQTALWEDTSPAAYTGLHEALSQIDESFSQMLLRKIDESGLTDAQVYKKANIDRKLFSKIRSDKHYKPSKPTVLAFAIALELPFAQANEMLQKAGFALSHSNKFDIIIEYFILHGNYNIHEINEALFAFDQSLLGV